MSDKIVVLVTCGSEEEARSIARELVHNRSAACVNILANPVRSIYRWKGSVEEAEERLLIIKTTRRHFRGVQSAIARLHSYEVPEVIALPITAGSKDYLEWLADAVAEPQKKKGGAHGKGRRRK